MNSDQASETDGGYATSFGVADQGERERYYWLRQAAVVAHQEYRLSVRNRWALALAGLYTLFSLLLVGVGGTDIGSGRVDVVLVSLTSLATYLLPLAALAFGYDTIVGADRDGWLDVVFALPTPRWAVVVGMYLGRAVTLTVATAIGFGLAGVALFVAADWLDPAYAVFLLGAVGLGLSFLAVSVLLSTLAVEKTHALGAALLAWVWFVFVHDLLALWAVAAFDLGDAALSALLLANPADVFRVLVLSQMDTTGGLATVYASAGLPIPVLVAALLAWCVVPVALAGRLVRRRSV